MHTYLDLKNAVSNILGRTDGATANTIRDNFINDVRREEIANRYPFSWLEKTTNLSTDSDGASDLPEDFNISHRPRDVRVVVSGSGNDDILRQVTRQEWDAYGTGDHVYYIDRNTTTDRWRINTKEESDTVRVIYYHIPATLTADTDIDIIPSKDVIANLAGARYWLSSERDETNHDRFLSLGKKKLDELIVIDKRSRPTRLHRGSIYTYDLGFNR